MKKYLEEVVVGFVGWIGSLISMTMFTAVDFFTVWIQPVIVAMLCAFGALIVSHFGKRLFKWIDKR